MGCDPELILVDSTESIVKAGDVLNRADDFGVDGHQFTAELRPTPATHPRDLVVNLRRVLGSRVQQLQGYQWYAGPWVCDRPLGGHIHFGTPLQDYLRDALDVQLGIVLALIEPPIEAAKRRTTVFYGDRPYGQLGDFRTKKWGFEYRTPGSFIVSPGTTLGVLALAKAIVWEELHSGRQAYSQLKDSDRTALHFTPQDFYLCKRDIFLPKLDLLRRQFYNMLYFKPGHEGSNLWSAVKYLLHQVIPKGGYGRKRDLKDRWRLMRTTYTPPSPYWQDLGLHKPGWWNPEYQTQFVLNTPNGG